ncbi:flagellar hook capping protein [Microcella daejeonensis]|uniref:Flagellar hook capping protein n=1 Tax=Microcella daejeonensis TaxID=2994971 RepID=A0A9E8MLJ0_9MICO|nr:flagellar hook capping FlgD N-terminal domain-containing protein [Microcella daejeonensis]WAB81731.1 flagellar hook capping protein [Microcella daejeonensis]
MPVIPIAAAGPAATPATAPPPPAQTMGSEVFMSLLVAQLRNQDPSSPMDTNEMIAQTTQLAMMESLTGLTGLTEEGFGLQMRIAATAIVGSTVSYRDADGVERSGTATSVSFRGSVPMVTVDGIELPLDAVDGVRAAGQPAAAPAP